MAHPGISRFTAQHWLSSARDHAWRSALAVTARAATLAGLPGLPGLPGNNPDALTADQTSTPGTSTPGTSTPGTVDPGTVDPGTVDPGTACVSLSDMDPSVLVALTRRLELDTAPHAHAEVSTLVVWIRTELWALHSFDDAERAARTGLLSHDPVELDPAVLLAAALRAGVFSDAAGLAAAVSCRELTRADAHCLPHLARSTGCIPALLESVATGDLPVADAVAAVLAAAEDSRSRPIQHPGVQSQRTPASHVQPHAVPAP